MFLYSFFFFYMTGSQWSTFDSTIGKFSFLYSFVNELYICGGSCGLCTVIPSEYISPPVMMLILHRGFLSSYFNVHICFTRTLSPHLWLHCACAAQNLCFIDLFSMDPFPSVCFSVVFRNQFTRQLVLWGCSCSSFTNWIQSNVFFSFNLPLTWPHIPGVFKHLVWELWRVPWKNVFPVKGLCTQKV